MRTAIAVRIRFDLAVVALLVCSMCINREVDQLDSFLNLVVDLLYLAKLRAREHVPDVAPQISLPAYVLHK